MRLIDFIITIFQTRWNDKIFTNVFHEYQRFKFFVREVLQFKKIIEEAQDIYGPDLVFAIWSENSTSYIACYLALILSNVNFYLIHANTSVQVTENIIVIADINFLFSSKNLLTKLSIRNKVFAIPTYKVSYCMEDKVILYSKENSFSPNLQHFAKENDLQYLSIFTEEYIDNFIGKHFQYKSKGCQRLIGIFSSGVETLYPNAVYFTDEDIYEGLIKLNDTDLLPSIDSKKVYTSCNFAEAQVWTILWVLSNNASFCFFIDEADIIIDNSHVFETRWNNEIAEPLYEKFLLGKLMLNDNFRWLFAFLAKRRVKKLLNKTFIVLNARLPKSILNSMIKMVPFYTTYGLQETNQILSINNYSTRYHKRDNCVGEVIDGINTSIREPVNFYPGEGSLVLISDVLSSNLEFEKGSIYDTRDHASLQKINSDLTLLFVYGRMKHVIKDCLYTGGNYESLELALKNIPYFKEVMIYEDPEQNLHVVVYPNVKVVGVKRYGLADFKNFIKQYKDIINDKFGNDFISSIKYVYKDFIRTPDKKIRKVLYYPSTLDL